MTDLRRIPGRTGNAATGQQEPGKPLWVQRHESSNRAAAFS
jgi:hypothetical protein